MKKVVSLMLVLILVFSMATMASAATIDRNDYDNYPGVFGTVTGSYDVVIVQERDEVRSNISFDNFQSDIATFGNTMTKLEWDASKIDVKTIVTKGNAAIDSVSVEWQETSAPIAYTFNKKAYNKKVKYAPYLKITFNDEFASNDPDGIPYEVKAYIVVNGRNWPDSGIVVSGDYKNDKQQYPIAADDSDVYIGDGTIVEAGDYNKNVEFHIGKNDNDDVSLFSKVFKSRKYWALASSADGEDAMYEKHSTLLGAYSVRTKGFVDNDVKILFNDLDSSIFVYGESDGVLTYVGKGNEKLDYYSTYYYSDKELELDDGDEPIDEDGDGYEVPGETGGDDYYPENVNDNPGTGR